MSKNEEITVEYESLEDIDNEADEEFDLGSFAVGAVLGVGAYITGRKLAEFAVETLRVKMYKQKGLDVQRGDKIFKTNIGGEEMWMRVGSRDGMDTIEFITPNEPEEKEEEVQEVDPTEK